MHKKSIKYFVAWIIAFFALGIIILAFSINHAITNNVDSMDLPENIKLIIGVFVLLLGCPTLYAVHIIAKKEKARIIMAVSLFLLIFICVCILSTIIPILGA